MLIRKYLSILLIGLVFAIAGCSSGGSSSGINEELPDTDGDGINNDNDGDIDGDGTSNGEDDDIDGDGKPNDSDHDDDGDGKPDDQDDTPGGPAGPPPGDSNTGGDTTGTACTTTKITWPNDEIQAGKNATITWKLLPAGCALAKGQNQSVKPTATHKNTTTVGVSKKSGSLTTNIVVPCAPNQGDTSRAVKYDFSELGTALGDKLGGYKNTIHHAAPTKGCAGDTKPDLDAGPGEPNQCPSDAAGTYPNCSCPDGYNYNESKNDCLEEVGNELPGDEVGNELPDEPELCTSVTFTAPQEAKFDSSYELTWRLSPEGCIPHNGNEKLTPMMWGRILAPEITVDIGEQLILDPVPGWPPLDGKATIDVPDSKFCSGDYDRDDTSDGKVGVLGFDDRSDCKIFKKGAVGKAGTCDGFRIPLLSCP